MDIIRLATLEEIESIKDTSDLSFATSVVTFGGKDFAVLRNCFELDPMHFHPDTDNRRKLSFGMNLETSLRLQGIKEFYCNVASDNLPWQAVLKNWGMEPTTDYPQIRFKKVL